VQRNRATSVNFCKDSRSFEEIITQKGVGLKPLFFELSLQPMPSPFLGFSLSSSEFLKIKETPASNRAFRKADKKI